MLKFLAIVIPLLAADVWWWRESDRRLCRLRIGHIMRGLLAIFIAFQIAYLLWQILGVFVNDLPEWRPIALPIEAYLWHVLLLPAGCAWYLLQNGWGHWLKHRLSATPERPADFETRRSTRQEAAPPRSNQGMTESPTRRQILAAAAIAAPPLVSLLAAQRGLGQIGEFRVRRIELEIPELPGDLHGLTIAHVTDLHIGRFMPPELTGAMADATNALDCDLIAFTGDLIDASQRRVAPGIEFMRRLRPRHGLVMIQGNHDVVRNAGRFEAEIKGAGLPLLLDESAIFRIPGRPTPIQFLGITWGELKSGIELHRHGKERNQWFREYSDAARDASVRRVAALRQPGTFPILLAHHPHAFDAAAAAGLPLVLSGHTHGGQIMLTPDIGAGPLRFRYWAGLYRKPRSQLFISNGIGSWFPLRVNAPSEIVKITLLRSDV